MATLEENKTTLKNDNPKPLYKNVNGTKIALTDSEYNAQIEEWATNMTAQQSYDNIYTNGGSHADYLQMREQAIMSNNKMNNYFNFLNNFMTEIGDGHFGDDAKNSDVYKEWKAIQDKYTST
jgi:pyoverdine/dityrosine biosynthesis protein Dit1